MNTWDPKVGDGACLCIGSDRYPCTVIARTAKSITLQEDNVVRVNEKGAMTDVFMPNPNGSIRTARLTQNGWRCGGKRGTPIGNYRSNYRDPSF